MPEPFRIEEHASVASDTGLPSTKHKIV